jgi:hypothetical protein
MTWKLGLAHVGASRSAGASGSGAKEMKRRWLSRSAQRVSLSSRRRVGLAGRDVAGPADPVHLWLRLVDQLGVPQFHRRQNGSRDPGAGVNRFRQYPRLGRVIHVGIHCPWSPQA